MLIFLGDIYAHFFKYIFCMLLYIKNERHDDISD